MSSSGSVTMWIEAMKAGDALAAQRLWEGYFQKLVRLAHYKMQGRPQASADEEDVALSAFDSFFRGAAENRFRRLEDRDDLWELLVLLMARKIYRLIQREHTKKRGGGAVMPLSACENEDAALEVMGREPTPDDAAQVADECRRLMEKLGDDELRAVAVDKMDGYTNAEIAARRNVVERTVENRLRLIRKLWTEDTEEEGPS